MKGLKEQMTKRYIVKNCPNYNEYDDEWNCLNTFVDNLSCADCTDCLIKQVVEKCREEENWVNCSNNKPTETAKFAQELL